MSAFYLKLSKDWQENFLLYAASAIIVSTCLGGLAVFAIFQNGGMLVQMIQLFLVVAICNAVLASILTVQKPKIVLNSLIASIIITLSITAINLLF
ncbi:MAG: hypothetical protein KTR22_13860 [Flavobacteriaceae bacterium]|nr:hypothetical protein [Flavobacteriaceae bacterium]